MIRFSDEVHWGLSSLQIVSTVIAGTVQLGVQSWWVNSDIYVPQWSWTIWPGCFRIFRQCSERISCLRFSIRCSDICSTHQKDKWVLSSHNCTASNIIDSFTCAATHVFATASVIVSQPFVGLFVVDAYSSGVSSGLAWSLRKAKCISESSFPPCG